MNMAQQSIYDKLDKDIEANKELFNFVLDNDKDLICELASNTDNTKTINFLCDVENKEILSNLYTNPYVRGNEQVQLFIAERVDTEQLMFKGVEKSLDQKAIDDFVEHNRESFLDFISKTKSEALMDKLPLQDDFMINLSKNRSISSKIKDKIITYAYNGIEDKNLSEQQMDNKKTIFTNLSNNKAVSNDIQTNKIEKGSELIDGALSNIQRQFSPYSEETLQEFKNSKDKVQNKIGSVSDLITNFKKKQPSQLIKNKNKSLSIARGVSGLIK